LYKEHRLHNHRPGFDQAEIDEFKKIWCKWSNIRRKKEFDSIKNKLAIAKASLK
jgi:hypothetical protein